VETILIGYPMPEIYVWQQVADAETGKQKYSVVDGQQRLTAMMQFVSNEWRLASKYLEQSNPPKDYLDKYWKDISPDTKRLFWDYVINVRTIQSDVSIEQIQSIFTRLNETDKSLNPQEIRNAEFNGAFIQNAERVADLPSFQGLGVFTDHQVRRMADMEFTSSLLTYLRRGLIEENTKSVNETYDLYNDEYLEADADLALVEGFFRTCLEKFFLDHRVANFFVKPVHLFTLFCVTATCAAQDVSVDQISRKLKPFVDAYDAEHTEDNLILRYREGASSRTRSRASREKRIGSLLTWIKD
tara:strand:+ start:2586 stop:3485 length:900 start_codon:yes stop_codon:yes gene_type:complete